jgi:hypothetical protein
MLHDHVAELRRDSLERFLLRNADVLTAALRPTRRIEYKWRSGGRGERRIVERKLQELTNDEMARRLHLPERTVRRTLKALQARLTCALEGGVSRLAQG